MALLPLPPTSLATQHQQQHQHQHQHQQQQQEQEEQGAGAGAGSEPGPGRPDQESHRRCLLHSHSYCPTLKSEMWAKFPPGCAGLPRQPTPARSPPTRTRDRHAGPYHSQVQYDAVFSRGCPETSLSSGRMYVLDTSPRLHQRSSCSSARRGCAMWTRSRRGGARASASCHWPSHPSLLSPLARFLRPPELHVDAAFLAGPAGIHFATSAPGRGASNAAAATKRENPAPAAAVTVAAAAAAAAAATYAYITTQQRAAVQL